MGQTCHIQSCGVQYEWKEETFMFDTLSMSFLKHSGNISSDSLLYEDL